MKTGPVEFLAIEAGRSRSQGFVVNGVSQSRLRDMRHRSAYTGSNTETLTLSTTLASVIDHRRAAGPGPGRRRNQ